MIEDIIHKFVHELGEEAQSQIQIKANDIESVEFPCTENDYVKLAVEATLMEDPIEALNAVLEAHAWVMTREDIKEEGGMIVERLLDSSDVLSKQELLDMSTNLWEGSLQWVKEAQNKKLVNMIIGETNGKKESSC